jgi:DNA-binding beta-propeller fold protein YncE
MAAPLCHAGAAVVSHAPVPDLVFLACTSTDGRDMINSRLLSFPLLACLLVMGAHSPDGDVTSRRDRPVGQDSSIARVIATLDVGKQPHGIRFDANGDSAWVALAGENAIAVIDVRTMRVVRTFDVGGTPLDMVPAADGGWLVSQFGESTLRATASGRTWDVGSSPSLFAPAIVRNRAFVVSEFGDRLTIFDLVHNRIEYTVRTGRRPYPPAVTRDGSLVFVPDRNDNAVTVIDGLTGDIVTTVAVCGQPYGGGLTPDDVTYVVVCGGLPSVMYINTASFDVTAAVSGFGRRPFSIVFSGDGRWGLVNIAGESQVAVLDVYARRIVDSVAVGDRPIAIRMHPDGRRAFISNEVSGTVSVIALPAPTARPIEPKNEVIVLGMIHGSHRTSERYGLAVLRSLVRAIEPDYVLTEIPPNRFELAKAEFEQLGSISESRVRVFPEYVDVMFPLTREMQFEIVPTAAWNAYMNSYRTRQLERIAADPARATDWAEYQRASARRDSMLAAEGDPDDPRFIHTARYDSIMDIGYEPYDRLFNDDLGPGGWTNINRGHLRYIENALDAHRGEGRRFLVTYGAAHKGPILRALRKRNDITILDPSVFLDRIGESPMKMPGDAPAAGSRR